MRFTSPSRRALGLLAVTAIGSSTALLGFTGVASAEPVEGDGPVLADVAAEAVSDTLVVPGGVCAVRFLVFGGAGDPAGADTGFAGLVTTTVLVEEGDSFDLEAGSASSGPDLPGEDSSVDGPGTFRIVAPGGSGDSTPRPGNTISPDAASIEEDNALDTTTEGTDFEATDGGVLAVGVLCPEAPTGLFTQAGPGQVQLVFTRSYDDPDEPLDDAPTYAVSVDGGAWTDLAVSTFDATFNQVSGTVDGLVNGTAHSFRVRATTTIGVSEVAGPVTATPYLPIGAPQDVVVTTGPSTVTVRWSGTVTPGTFALAGWSVGYSGGDYGDEACRLAASVTSCTFALPAGQAYGITVFALDSGSNSGEAARVRSGVVPGPTVPSSVPTKDDGDITGPAGPISKLIAGQKVTLQGSGFAPGSTVQLTVFSAPISLGTVVTDSTGSFSVEVTVPANLSNGTHHLVATGVDANGVARNLVIAVAVSGGQAVLATTGFDAVPVAVGGGLVLLTGAGLLVGVRRRAS